MSDSPVNCVNLVILNLDVKVISLRGQRKQMRLDEPKRLVHLNQGRGVSVVKLSVRKDETEERDKPNSDPTVKAPVCTTTKEHRETKSHRNKGEWRWGGRSRRSKRSETLLDVKVSHKYERMRRKKRGQT